MIIINVYFVLVTVILMLLFDGYQFSRHFLSALGTNEIGWIFNSAVILLGLSSLIFYITIYSLYSEVPIFLRIAFLILGIVSSVALLSIGVFVFGGEMSKTHDFFAILYFMLLIPLSLVFAWLMKLTKSGSILIGLAITTSIITFVGLFIPGVNQFIFQKLIVYTYNVFLVTLGRRILSTKS